LTDKPVVGIGRFTSPDVMLKTIKSGTLDFISCNICVTGDMTMSISRYTQNPTFKEEWRKGWHPERRQAFLNAALRTSVSRQARPGGVMVWPVSMWWRVPPML